MKNLIAVITCLFSLTGINLSAQKSGTIVMDDIVRSHYRQEILIPDLPGYKTLKCDFHIHTVFSDGTVWPTVRVNEAWEDGLDAIAITDHIEGQPKKLPGQKHTEYEIALASAQGADIILVKGGEISRSMPPGHFNALFIKDVNALDVPDYLDAIGEAIKQGGFIIWNHPGWITLPRRGTIILRAKQVPGQLRNYSYKLENVLTGVEQNLEYLITVK
jgi:3',5'-nucleoside bisphosphate phosphatase